MAPDLIIYGLVAAGLVLWLRNLLGTKHGDERVRSVPLSFTAEAEDSKTLPDIIKTTVQNLIDSRTGKIGIRDANAASAILDIHAMDKSFDPALFLEAAQDAFVMIVEAFAKGDRETLRDLLADPVYLAFSQEIEARAARGEIASTEIRAIRRAEILAAEKRGNQALITVQFTAEQTSALHSRDGVLLAGAPDKRVTVRDAWVFSRDLRGRDPRWLLQETYAVGEDDTSTPNTIL